MTVEEGEGRQLLDQIRLISRDLFTNLIDIDDRLKDLERYLNVPGDIDKRKVRQQIAEMRRIIGAMEKEDAEEIEEEKILENMIKKLNDLIEMTIG